ncbi:hypothetical protein M569_13966, partial [Genlisea aurea]
CSPHLMFFPTLYASTNCKKGRPGLVMRLYSSVSDQTLTDVNSEKRKEVLQSTSLYVHPTLLQMKNERMLNRKRVYDFLQSIGIIPDELDGLELPVTVEVMRERVDFLRKLGLTVQDINNYPLVLGCSVKKNMIPVLDYLGKLGVRKSSFTEFLRRYPQVLHASVVVDLAPVVKYLQGMDVKPGDIPRVLEAYPEVLGFKLEGTMSTSVAYLVAIGVSRREIGGLVARYPEVLGMRVGRVIKPFVEYLMSLGMPCEAVATLIEKRPQVLGFGVKDRVKPNVELLLDHHVRKSSLVSVISRYPEIVGIFDLEAKLVDQREFLSSATPLSPEEFGKALEKMPQIVILGEETILRHVDFLKQCGFSVDQVKEMVVACPQVLALDISIMKASFDYFVSVMKRPLDDLVAFPAYFTYGLESTIKRRHKMVVRRGVTCSLSWLLNCSDEKFEDRITYDSIDMDEMEENSPTQSRIEESDSEFDEDSD